MSALINSRLCNKGRHRTKHKPRRHFGGILSVNTKKWNYNAVMWKFVCDGYLLADQSAFFDLIRPSPTSAVMHTTFHCRSRLYLQHDATVGYPVQK